MSDSQSNSELKSSVRRSRIIAAIVVVVLVALVAVFASRPSPESRQAQNAKSALIGKPAPQVVGQSIAGGSSNGQGVNLEQLRGRWVVVNFFATWCQPCIEEHPELLAFYNLHSKDKANGPQMISVAYQDKASNVADFFARNGGEWPVLADDSGATALSFGARGLPETFIVDPSGTITGHISGGVTVSVLAKETQQ